MRILGGLSSSYGWPKCLRVGSLDVFPCVRCLQFMIVCIVYFVFLCVEEAEERGALHERAENASLDQNRGVEAVQCSQKQRTQPQKGEKINKTSSQRLKTPFGVDFLASAKPTISLTNPSKALVKSFKETFSSLYKFIKSEIKFS